MVTQSDILRKQENFCKISLQKYCHEVRKLFLRTLQPLDNDLIFCCCFSTIYRSMKMQHLLYKISVFLNCLSRTKENLLCFFNQLCKSKNFSVLRRYNQQWSGHTNICSSEVLLFQNTVGHYAIKQEKRTLFSDKIA